MLIPRCKWVPNMTLFVETHIKDCCPGWLLMVSLVLQIWIVDSVPLAYSLWSVTMHLSPYIALFCIVSELVTFKCLLLRLFCIFATFSLYLYIFAINCDIHCHHFFHSVQHCGRWYAMLSWSVRIWFLHCKWVPDQTFLVETHFRGSVSLLEKFETLLLRFLLNGIDRFAVTWPSLEFHSRKSPKTRKKC